jgi:hypothetical protein
VPVITIAVTFSPRTRTPTSMPTTGQKVGDRGGDGRALACDDLVVQHVAGLEEVSMIIWHVRPEGAQDSATGLWPAAVPSGLYAASQADLQGQELCLAASPLPESRQARRHRRSAGRDLGSRTDLALLLPWMLSQDRPDAAATGLIRVIRTKRRVSLRPAECRFAF